ncbi:MAG: hypothetical protein R3F61_32075 [Myxococcota bacterium]
MAKRTAGGPAIALIVSGVLGLLYALVYFVWTLMPVFWGVLAVVANISEKGFSSETIEAALLFLSMPLVQAVLFAITVVTALITLFAGVRFNQWRSKGLVWLGLLCSTLTPILGAVGNSASMLNCGTVGVGLFGCLLGNAGTIPVFVIGLVASVWGIVVLSGDAGAHFDEA